MVEKSSHSADFLQIVERLDMVIKSILGSKKPWYEKVGKIVEAIVPEIEVIGEDWKGADKKQMALELIEDIYFRYLQSKYIPDFIERVLVNILASKGIDSFVALMNKKGLFVHK